MCTVARASTPLEPRADIYASAPDHAVVADLTMPGNGEPVYVVSVIRFTAIRSSNGASGLRALVVRVPVSPTREFPQTGTRTHSASLEPKYSCFTRAYYRELLSPAWLAAVRGQPRLQFVATSTWEEGECRLYRLVR